MWRAPTGCSRSEPMAVGRTSSNNAGTDTNALGAGETGTETFNVATADGTTAQVVITVTGANDAAAIGGQTTGAVTEDAATTTATGALTVADPDAGEATFEEQSNVEGTYGTFTLEADGGWTYTLNNADTDTNALAVGETGTETFNGRDRGRHFCLGGRHGDGCGRRGDASKRAHHRCGDRGRYEPGRGERDAEGGGPGHGADE